jgi:flagellar motility protein MotE (MotC chaperone)
MKIVIYIVVALLGFCAVVAATLYFKGALNKETIASLMGKEPQDQEEIAAPSGQPLMPIATALKEKEKQLAQREEEVSKDEDRIKQERADLESERKKLEDLLKKMETQLGALDADEAQRLSDLAKTYAEMEPQTAAQILDQMFAAGAAGSAMKDDAVKILRQIKAKDRAQIVEQMKNSVAVSRALMSATQN